MARDLYIFCMNLEPEQNINSTRQSLYFLCCIKFFYYFVLITYANDKKKVKMNIYMTESIQN